MKKILILTATMISIFSMLTGCGSNSNDSQINDANSSATTQPESSNSQTNETKKNNATSSSESISMSGSTSMEKIITDLVEAFEDQNPGMTITYDVIGSSASTMAITEGTADVGISGRDIKESETDLEATVIAWGGIAIIVNNENKINDLSTAQIEDIFTGRSTNWNEIGRDDATVTVVGREAESATRVGFESIVGVKEKFVYDQEFASTEDIITAVAANQYAIGYVPFSSISSEVKSLTVNGVPCTEDTIRKGTYTIQRPFHLITASGAKLSEKTKAFVKFVKSDKATELLKNAGAVQVR